MIPIENARKMGLIPQESNLPTPPQRAPDIPVTDAEIQAMMNQMDQEEGQMETSGEATPLTREQKIMRDFGKDGPISDFDAAGHVNIAEMCQKAGIKLIEQKKARRDVRKLVNKMRSQEEEKWPDLVMGAIIENVGVFHYINATCVYTALREAGTDKELADRIVAALRAHETVPDDLRYTADTPFTPPEQEDSDD